MINWYWNTCWKISKWESQHWNSRVAGLKFVFLWVTQFVGQGFFLSGSARIYKCIVPFLNTEMCECVHKGPYHLFPVVHLFTKSCDHDNAKHWVPFKELASLSLSFVCQIILPVSPRCGELWVRQHSTTEEFLYHFITFRGISTMFLWQCVSALVKRKHFFATVGISFYSLWFWRKIYSG